MYLRKVIVHGFRAATDAPLECLMPGRFAVLAGPNSAGKSTVVEAILLSHRDVFPFTPRPRSTALSRTVVSRTIEVSYALEDNDSSPLGMMCSSHGQLPNWTTELSSSLGRVYVSRSDSVATGSLPVLYLSPTRNPATDLSGRGSRLIVELLRSQALRDTGDKSLRELRGRLGGLIGSVVSAWPVADVEQRVAESLAELTDGVSGRVPFLATTSIDDTFLARVFEFLLAAHGLDRVDANRLETEGLGYANLLQLAVVLAAIPDLTRPTPASDSEDGDESEMSGGRTDEDLRLQVKEAEKRRDLENDTFFADSFHAVVVLEEPEAHLHPQLQHGIVRYLKEVVTARPEVQVVITTHSDEIVAACDPTDLVVFRRGADGTPAARTIKSFEITRKSLSRARRHLDTTRSASLFGARVVLVEGITDAIVLRAIARVWAGEDRMRTRFVDALTITVLGSRIGRWMPDLLVQPGMEIAVRLAVLRDTDGEASPAWVEELSSPNFEVFLSAPTLEPSLVAGNEDTIAAIFNDMSLRQNPWSEDIGPTADNVQSWFATTGAKRKASFAELFAQTCETDPGAIVVPDHFSRLLEFVWSGFVAVTPEDIASTSTEAEQLEGE